MFVEMHKEDLCVEQSLSFRFQVFMINIFSSQVYWAYNFFFFFFDRYSSSFFTPFLIVFKNTYQLTRMLLELNLLHHLLDLFVKILIPFLQENLIMRMALGSWYLTPSLPIQIVLDIDFSTSGLNAIVIHLLQFIDGKPNTCRGKNICTWHY